MTIPEILKRIIENFRLLSDGSISEIDRDILLEDIRHLYLMAKGGEVSRPSMSVDVKPAPVDTLPVIEFVTKHEPAAPVIVEQEKPLPPVEEIPVVRAKRPEIIAPVAETEGAPDEPKSKPSSLNEVFAGEERSLNERLSGGKKPALNDQAGRKDLKSMIDFNKQYVLINELFKGDSQAFQAAIHRINESPTIESAFEFIKTELMPRYKWGTEMQSARLFDKLVRQKFGMA